MPTHRLPIDWLNLLEAVHASEDGDFHWQFDLRTGEVWPKDSDPGMRDDDEEDEDEDAAERLVDVAGLTTRKAWAMRADFAAEVADPLVREDLQRALEGKGAFRRFQDALQRTDGLRDAWYAYERERALERARQWLADNDIEATNDFPT